MEKHKTDGSRSQMIENNFPLEHPSLESSDRLPAQKECQMLGYLKSLALRRAWSIFRLDRLDNISATFNRLSTHNRKKTSQGLEIKFGKLRPFCYNVNEFICRSILRLKIKREETTAKFLLFERDTR